MSNLLVKPPAIDMFLQDAYPGTLSIFWTSEDLGEELSPVVP